VNILRKALALSTSGSSRAISRCAVATTLTSLCLVVSACQTPDTAAPSLRAITDSPIASGNLALRGVKALKDGDPDLASRLFNAALKLDVQNSKLQMLNGLAYHIRAVRNDATLFDLAEEGYRLAIQFDESNWTARYYLGLLDLDRRRYRDAQSSLAEALLYNDQARDLLYSFAVASYYARDPQTAAGALKKLRDLGDETPRTFRASSIVAAALGNQDEAALWRNKYASLPGDAAPDSLSRRLSDWARFYARAQPSLAQWKLSAEADPLSDRSERAKGILLAQATETDRPARPEAEGDSSGEKADTDDGGSDAAGDSDGEDKPKKMVIVDVVIISSVEDNSSAMGVNLLNGLTLQFGSSANDAYSLTRNIVRDTAGTGQAETTTIVRALTIPKITYSLNIANSGSNRNEILARPSLVAVEGEKSEFFSGENIKASAVSKTAQEGSTSVDQDIGVKLAVSPSRVDKGGVAMQIEVERTFLQSPSSSVRFDFQIRTSKTNVSANVTLKQGETLILSGLSEKETESTRDGVPGLQEVPGLQYLFSRQTKRDFNRSVLVLMTPREPEYTFRPKRTVSGKQAGPGGETPVSDSEGEALHELKARYSDWFRPYPNWASVFHHLQNNKLYREFRTGDVTLERWDSQATRDARLNRALEFLRY
jgi:tetratricopeptide (TPR) repeat protein